MGGILLQIGPGLILAGTIVGSGELLLTTKTGAEAGFSLLWLIILGCVLKVFVQVEFGRYAVCTGQGTLSALNRVPGPRARVSWLIMLWFIAFLISFGLMGGIIAGVAECITILPGWSQNGFHLSQTWWALILTMLTIGLLWKGKYSTVQRYSTVMVMIFTFVTAFSVLMLQSTPDLRIRWEDLRAGLSFHLPTLPAKSGDSPLIMALMTFGIIGVGAHELIYYAYWCIEKGYARFVGPRDGSSDWAERASSWLRVMRWDAFIALGLYTVSTAAFYLLGAAVLHRKGLVPANSAMVKTVGQMYAPSLGVWADWIYSIGAFMVLYSTFLGGSAGHARLAADAVCVFGGGALTPLAKQWWVRLFSVIIPTLCFTSMLCFKAPLSLIWLGAASQALLLPFLGGTALYLRYYCCDPRVTPGKVWSFFLWLSVVGVSLLSLWLAIILGRKAFGV